MVIGNSKNDFTRRLGACLAAFFALTGGVAAQAPIKVYTDDWAPYVRSHDDDLGSAARIVRLVLDDMGREADFEYFDFAYSYRLVETGRAPLSFPYFRTPAREGAVTFSAPLFKVRTLVFYNRRFHDLTECNGALREMKFGRVAGYSYGDEIDAFINEPVMFASETEAIEALLAGAIDALPMTASVASAFLEERFADRRELVQAIENCESEATLHVIAPKTQEGQALIDAFNASHARLLQAGVIVDVDQSALTAFARKDDIAELVAAEGFPVIVGVDPNDGAHYAIPQGARAIVLEWSPRISEPSQNDRLYQTMVEESLVVILNGPHVGKELRVKNMHITIIE